MTPLAGKLAALIRANGPITVADYMAACLGDPEHGYYMRREPFGPGGDFITAPEVSQMFGELIGAWAVAAWEAMGAPSPFALVELGPGRGTLMKDLLRTARLRPAFIDAARIHLVETSPRLREIQRETLDGAAVAWHERVDDIPAAPTIVIANEFFDALPIRQFVRAGGGWAERMVGLDGGGALMFGLRPIDPLPMFSSPTPATPLPSSSGLTGGPARGGQMPPLREAASGPPVKPGDDGGVGSIVEINPASAAIMTALATRLRRDTGAALVIDYGYEGPATGDTLQAVRQHRFDNPLAAPGEADITAHVDFAALANTAKAAGATTRALLNQGEFLSRLGLAARAGGLKRGKDPATMTAIDAAAERLAGPAAMGELFKVLAISSPGLVLPAFDAQAGA